MPVAKKQAEAQRPASAGVAPARPARSLADDIRGRTDDELAALILARPDLARPAPADLTSLAARASTRASVQRCLESLDRGHLQVLEAVLVSESLGGSGGLGDSGGSGGSGASGGSGNSQPGRTAADPRGLRELLGDARDPGDTGDTGHLAAGPVLDRLWELALLWRGPDGVHVVRTVPEVVGAPAGLGPSVAELGRPWPERWTTPEDIAAEAAEAPPEAARMLERLTWGPPVGVLPPGALGGADAHTSAGGGRWLVERGLLVVLQPGEEARVVLPREVALALRGGRLFRRLELEPPDATEVTVGQPAADAAAGGQVSDLLTLVEDVTAAWGPEPPRVLRAGGLSVRDQRRLSDALDLEPARAAWVVELMHAAGLVADDGEVVPVWAPTALVDEWLGEDPGARWADLATAWLRSTRAAHLVGTRHGGVSSPVNALSPDLHWPPIRAIRADVLRELASLPPGVATTSESLLERLGWRRPLRVRTRTDDAVEAVLREAEWLGVTGRGALSDAGRLLATGADQALLAEAMSGQLPAAVDHVLIQADLTVIAPGPLAGALARLMRLVAEVESRGGATVHRLTPGSVRRALDAGWSADEVLDALRAASRTGIPQPVEYLVRDVARRHGQTRVGGATAYIRSDDEAALETVLADRTFAALQLRRIAPTVLVSQADPATLLELLREGGLAPVQERPDGSVVVEVAAQRRARVPASRRSPTVATVDSGLAAGLVAGLRAGEEVADERRSREASDGPRLEPTDPTVTIAALRDAAADHRGVWIGYADMTGRAERILFYPSRIEGGRAFGRVPDTAGGRGADAERTFSIHRITGVAAQ